MRESKVLCPLWVHRFAVLTAAATLGLIFVGALVTSTGSGLAVPDWPLSFGQVFPPMVGGVLFEHGHRLAAASVGILTVTLLVLLTHWDPRKWVHWLARGAVMAVILQGTLGGITVLLRLPTAVSVTHACLAQAFLCLTVALAVCTAPSWERPGSIPAASRGVPLAWLAGLTTAMVYLQLIIGALMRHTGAGLAIPDFPLAFGRLIPPFASSAIVMHFLHRLGALLVTLCIAWTAVHVLRQYRSADPVLRPALLLVGLIVCQLTLGAFTIWTQRAILPMTAHVAVGAAVLATSVVLMLRALRLVAAGAQVTSPGFLSSRVTA